MRFGVGAVVAGRVRERKGVGWIVRAHVGVLNQVERWFSELRSKKLRRSTHHTVTELRRDITDWVDHRNANPTTASSGPPLTRQRVSWFGSGLVRQRRYMGVRPMSRRGRSLRPSAAFIEVWVAGVPATVALGV